ncbi:MAG: hypothetical protein JSW55_17945 [Chloroflexota bacterium]|nr:MAG: hypothetical protein JSW55_17945 [Chloroflexota bacterium]
MPNQEGDSPGSQVQPTPSATAYPGPIEDGPAGPYDSTPGAYPAAPPTPIVFPTDSYPAGSEAGHAVNGTPIPNIGSQDAGPPTVEPSEIQDTKPEPILGTIFLWLGFGAAFAVFISSIVAAIYYYDRRRATSN